jgi:glycosyltransferase involved in cell wall biosynthesis
LGGRITELLTKNGVPAKKVISIPNAIEEQWIQKADIQNFNPRRFVFIGRYSEVKGIDILDQALNKLLAVHPFEMHFIGPIPEDKQVRSSSVIYHGAIHNEAQIQEILYTCDVLVSPSYTEGMPTVILEAMAAGCAIIATDVGAVPEVVDEKIGWLIPSGNVTALYDAMEQAIQSTNNSLAVVKLAAREKVRAYTWQNIIEKTIEEIENRIK